MIQALAIAAFICLLISLRRFRRRKYRRAVFLFLLSLLFTGASVFYYSVSINLDDYDLILEERDIVEVDISSNSGDLLIRITDLVNQRSYSWTPKGSEWRLVLRELRFYGICEDLGWSPGYRLASLESFDTPPEGEKPVLHSVTLQQPSQGSDVWLLVRRLIRARPYLEPRISSCMVASRTVTDSTPLATGKYRYSFVNSALKQRKL